MLLNSLFGKSSIGTSIRGKQLLDSYVDKEIIDCLPHLENLLHQNNLANKDVFVFFMPLDKAINDSDMVITDLKGSI